MPWRGHDEASQTALAESDLPFRTLGQDGQFGARAGH